MLCESDSDCKMYSIVENFIKQTEGKYSEALFIHCGGKHRMAKISTSMRALNIDIRFIYYLTIKMINGKTYPRHIYLSYHLLNHIFQNFNYILLSSFFEIFFFYIFLIQIRKNIFFD